MKRHTPVIKGKDAKRFLEEKKKNEVKMKQRAKEKKKKLDI
ncbi:MAG TPA: hypothetical protein VNM69_03830 [Bacillus sp. (in: firmicutes)]|nr:hypothetical protein [Bacillus sp. (in: firmicutes)]